MKETIKNQKGLTERMEEENKKLTQIELDRKEMVYNLNLIVPENLKEVEKDIVVYLFQSLEHCTILID